MRTRTPRGGGGGDFPPPLPFRLSHLFLSFLFCWWLYRGRTRAALPGLWGTYRCIDFLPEAFNADCRGVTRGCHAVAVSESDGAVLLEAPMRWHFFFLFKIVSFYLSFLFSPSLIRLDAPGRTEFFVPRLNSILFAATHPSFVSFFLSGVFLAPYFDFPLDCIRFYFVILVLYFFSSTFRAREFP